MKIHASKTTVVFLSLLALAVPARGAGTGTSAAPFLKIDAGARAAAMGGAFCAVADDVTGMHYNPAGTARMYCPELSVMHRSWIEDMGDEYLGYVYAKPGARVRFGASLSYLHIDDLVKRDVSGNETGGTFGAAYGLAVLNAGVRYSPSLAFGVNLKTVYESVHDRKATAYAGDLGVIYAMDDVPLGKYGSLRRVRLGAAVQNLGTKLSLYRDSFSLPVTIRLGIGVDISPDLLAAVDVSRVNDESTTVLHLGTEYWILDMLAVRLGYRHAGEQSPLEGFTAGFGLVHPDYRDYRLDYAYIPAGDFGATQTIALSLRIGDRGAKEARKARKAAAPKPKPRDRETTGLKILDY